MTWSRHSRRIEPTSLSAYPFCQGERAAVGRSRMPMGANVPNEPSTVDAIPITDHITRHLAPAESFDQLLRDPFCSRMGGYSQPKKFSTGMLQNQNSIQQPERNCRHHKQIH